MCDGFGALSHPARVLFARLAQRRAGQCVLAAPALAAQSPLQRVPGRVTGRRAAAAAAAAAGASNSGPIMILLAVSVTRAS